MPEPSNLLKAELREIKWVDERAEIINHPERTVQVQFNPESLKVSFSNQNAGGDQRGGSAVQFVGAGTTSLSLELWFDATRPLPNGEKAEDGDVRKLTEKVAYFITPQEEVEENKWKPAGVRFLWGTFMFDGVMDSLQENLEFFSEDGKPLRARLSISISSQLIQFQFNRSNENGNGGRTGNAGQQPHEPAREGDTMQGIAGRAGKASQWKGMARENGIENPRHIPPGTPINTRAG